MLFSYGSVGHRLGLGSAGQFPSGITHAQLGPGSMLVSVITCPAVGAGYSLGHVSLAG